MIVRCSWTAFHRIRCMNVKWVRKAFKKASFSTCHWYMLIMIYWWIPLTWKVAIMFYRNKRKCLRENRVQLPMAKWHFGSPKWPPWRHHWTIFWQNDLVLLSVQQPVKLMNDIKQRKTQSEETKQWEKYHRFLRYGKPTVRGKIVLFGGTNISWSNNITQVQNSGTTPITDEQLINWHPLLMINLSEEVTF